MYKIEVNLEWLVSVQIVDIFVNISANQMISDDGKGNNNKTVKVTTTNRCGLIGWKKIANNTKIYGDIISDSVIDIKNEKILR